MLGLKVNRANSRARNMGINKVGKHRTRLEPMKTSWTLHCSLATSKLPTLILWVGARETGALCQGATHKPGLGMSRSWRMPSGRSWTVSELLKPDSHKGSHSLMACRLQQCWVPWVQKKMRLLLHVAVQSSYKVSHGAQANLSHFRDGNSPKFVVC